MADDTAIKASVIEALENVQDPKSGKDLLDAHMIEGRNKIGRIDGSQIPERATSICQPIAVIVQEPHPERASHARSTVHCPAPAERDNDMRHALFHSVCKHLAHAESRGYERVATVRRPD